MEPVTKVQVSSQPGLPLNLATTADGETLIVAVTGKADGEATVLALEAVLQSDLAFARDEAWWVGVRTGRLSPDLNRLSMKLLPGPRQKGHLVDGYTVELGDGSESYGHRFSVHSLSKTAQRAITRLLEKRQLSEDSEVNYFLISRHLKQPLSEHVPQDGDVRVTVRHEPLHVEKATLAEYFASSRLITEARAAGPAGDDAGLHMPVFFHEQAWAKGHSLARRGNDLESAGVWTGRLMQDTDSPELFLVVDACIDAKHADEEKYSVTFSGPTWSRVRQVLQQRRRRLNRPYEMLVGSVHGHNFPPGTREDGGRLCDECPDLPTCRKTTAVLSTDDLTWHQSVFSAQPYALMAIWGWSARKEEVWQCYSLAGATLVSRPIRVLDARGGGMPQPDTQERRRR